MGKGRGFEQELATYTESRDLGERRCSCRASDKRSCSRSCAAGGQFPKPTVGMQVPGDRADSNLQKLCLYDLLQITVIRAARISR